MGSNHYLCKYFPPFIIYYFHILQRVNTNCPKFREKNNEYLANIGNFATFTDISILFFVVGTSFGVPFSMTKMNVKDWIYTKWYLRLIRTIIGAAISIGILMLFGLMTERQWYV